MLDLTIVVLSLACVALVPLLKGVQSWLKVKQGRSIILKRPDYDVWAKSLDPDTAAAIIEALTKHSEASPKKVTWNDIRPGLCAFDPPPLMKVGRSEIIAVRISPEDPADLAAMDKMIGTLHRPDQAQTEPIEVGRLMRARLHGEPDAFDITSLNSEDQTLELNKIACWDFNVRPKLSGQRWLQLVISVRVPEEGRVELRDLPALKRTIKVQVAPLETLKLFAAKRGEFIADKVLIPLIVLFAGALGLTAWLTGLLGGGQPTPVSPPAVPANPSAQAAPTQSSPQK
jgi:hypothetical protein